MYKEIVMLEIKYTKLDSLTTSGGVSGVKFTSYEIRELKKTVTVPIRLYRGLSLIRNRIDKRYWETVNKLSLHDNLPRFLQKSHIYSKYASYSRKLTVARYYAKGGDVSIIVEKTFTNKNNILIDFFNFSKMYPDLKFVRDNKDYFVRDKEVIVIEPINGLIIIKKRGFI